MSKSQDVVEYALWTLSNFERDDIESDDFDVAFEDDNGIEYFCTFSVTETAADALLLIESLTKQRDELLSAANDLYHGYVRTMEAGRDRIMELGGQCDPVDVMERCDNTLISARYVISKAKGATK